MRPFEAYPGMRRIIAVTIAVVVGAAARYQDPDVISSLHECIQLRFLDRTAFGMRRILPFGYHGIRIFQPENQTEQTVVSKLTDSGHQVVLYLAGRSVMDSVGTGVNPRRYRVQGPAFITPGPIAQYPGSDDLLDDSRRALTSFQTGGANFSIRKGEWTIAMRALRATNETCVQCHSSNGGARLNIGDPLGVALYVYR